MKFFKFTLTLILSSHFLGCGTKFKEEVKESKNIKVRKNNEEEIFNDNLKVTIFNPNNLILSENTKIIGERILVEKNPILTGSYSLTLEAEEIIFENSVIKNFPENTRTLNALNGSNGGDIIIKAKRSKGRLQLILNGESGKDGLDGEPKGESGRGKEGPRLEIKTVCERRKGHPENPRNGEYCRCEEFGISSNGGKGHPGNDGLPGGKGGNSGSLIMEIPFAKGLEIEIKKTPGDGGWGGRGGPGGPGGLPGLVTGDKACVLSPYRKGEYGPPGSNGKNGVDGKNGNEGLVCLLINGQKECSQ